MSVLAGGLNPLLGFAAGALTILSPCVLPLVPIVLAGARRSGRWGAVALSGGLVLSFTAIGFALAAAGSVAGLDGDAIRALGAATLVLAGLVLLIPQAQMVLARFAAPLANWASARQSQIAARGLWGQFAIGVLLGLVWSPCVGPTLGAATVLAAQGQDLVAVALTMLAFGLGIASVLLLISLAAQSVFLRWRGGLITAGSGGKRLLGIILVLVGVAVLTGLDRLAEGAFVSITPDWLNDLTTRF